MIEYVNGGDSQSQVFICFISTFFGYSQLSLTDERADGMRCVFPVLPSDELEESGVLRKYCCYAICASDVSQRSGTK